MSEKMKHTAVPWMAENEFVYALNNNNENIFYLSVQAGRGDRINKVAVRTPLKELEANARLIAAAPELLQSVNELIEQWRDLVNSGDAGNWNPETDEPIINARKVIAKATGAE